MKKFYLPDLSDFHFNRKFPVFFLVIFLNSFFSGNCGEVKPELMEKGTHCAHCKMAIADMKFHSEIVTKKGRHVHFDSIECLLYYLDSVEQNPKAVWVGEYRQKGILLDFEKSVFLISDKIISPMGANLSAYRNRQDAESTASGISGSRIMNPAEVREYIRNNWKNNRNLKFN